MGAEDQPKPFRKRLLAQQELQLVDVHLEVVDEWEASDLHRAQHLAVLEPGLPSQCRRFQSAKELDGARLVGEGHAQELGRFDLSHLIADDVAQVDVFEKVELGHLAARDLMHQDAIELGQDGDMSEHLMLRPFGFTTTRLDPRSQLSQPRRRFLEPVGKDVSIVVEHPIEELLDVGASESRALDLHASINLVDNRSMCYSDDARPPLPPISGAAADQGDLVLTSSDGTKFAAYFARAEKPTGAGMVVMPDVRGLHHFYKELAQRFAEAGIDAVAIDYFGRTAGLGDRGEGFEFMPHVEKTTPDSIRQDVAAAIAYLKSKDGGAVKSVFTVGFCFGGSSSWNQSAGGHGLNGAIGFYGRPERTEPFISKLKSPLLMLIAGADFTPQEAFHAFDKQLTKAKVQHEMHIYEGAPHSFFDRTFDQWKDACDDAWRRMLAFIKLHS